MTLVCIAFLSCGKKENTKDFPVLTKETVSVESIWERITGDTDYTAYEYMPEQVGMKKGQAPHGAFHKIFTNDIFCDELPIQSKTAPYGSIIVKENYSQDKILGALTVMVKVKDFNPKHNDWFWVKYSPDGKALSPENGKPEGCITCHSGKNDNDYIIVHKLDKELK